METTIHMNPLAGCVRAGILNVLCAFFLVHSALAQNAAPSSHMQANDHFGGDIIINEVRVPASGETIPTYYEALGWGGYGAGYAGIQAHPDGHNVIFSIWDNPVHTSPISVVHAGFGTLTEGFGGEGTGMKSWNFALGWQVDQWHALVARSWPVGDHTHYGFWVHRGDDSLWYHLVTMDVAIANGNFQGGNDAFIEDWLETGELRREVHFRRGWKRMTNGTWFPTGSMNYSVNSWDLDSGGRSYNYRTNWDGGVGNDATGSFYYMAAGGAATVPTATNPSTQSITRTDTQVSWPTMALHQLVVDMLSPTALRVRWDPDLSTSPQFAFNLKVFNNPAGTGAPLINISQTAPHIREHILDTSSLSTASTIYYLFATFTDIFDRQSSAAGVSFGSGTEPQYITVTSPNGGETYVTGSTQMITWNSQLASPLTIKLFKGGNEVRTLTTTATGGSYSWSLPYPLSAGSDYQVRIQNAAGTITDSSNANFAVRRVDPVHFLLNQELLSVHSFSSEQPEFGATAAALATNVLDGDPDTIWQTLDVPTMIPYPHEIVLRTNQTYAISGLRYLARPGAGSGTIANYEIYLSSDGATWGAPVATGTWGDILEPQDVTFPSREAQYIRLVALSEIYGDPSLATAAEINLFHTPTLPLVDSALDSGPGSLREAISVSPPGTRIGFDSSLSGETITLSSQLLLGKNLTIDGSALVNGITISGNNASRVFEVATGNTASMTNLTIINGRTADAPEGQGAEPGGGIYNNSATLIMSECVVRDNRTGDGGGNSFGIGYSGGAGGGIANGGSLTLLRCEISNNTTGDGGDGFSNGRAGDGGGIAEGGFGPGSSAAITECLIANNSVGNGGLGAGDGGGIVVRSSGTVITNSTISGNRIGSGLGGGLNNLANVKLIHCTVTGNAATTGFGGGIRNEDGQTMTMENTIVAGNTAPSGADINFTGSGNIVSNGVNFVGNNDTVLTQFPAGAPNGNEDFAGNSTSPLAPLLAPLGNYGGLTQTMALLPGSPARNAALLSPAISSDQRGFPTVGMPDIGAYEAGTLTNYNAWIWETLPATATAPEHAASFDFDGDSQSNAAEWFAFTDPGNANSRFAATSVRNGANLEITVPTALGRTYTLLQSATLLGGSWTAVPGIDPQAGTGSFHTFQIPIAAGSLFFQVRVSMP